MQPARLVLQAAAIAALTVVVLLTPPVTADCRTPNCKSQSSLGNCANPPTMPTSGALSGSEFKGSCLVDASKDCRAGSANNAGNKMSCCSCYLYVTYCEGKLGSYITNNKDPKNDAHTMVLPTQPCSGVENWYHGGCGGEGIWGYSEQLLASAGKTAGKWGMAINPIKRRGQHQMHVHIAALSPSLAAALAQGRTLKLKSFELDCSRKSTGLDCSLKKGADVKVNVYQGTALNAQPFNKVYQNPVNTVAAINLATLVVPMPNNEVAVVTNPNDQAECFFDTSKATDLYC